jgi:hypothetical protein
VQWPSASGSERRIATRALPAVYFHLHGGVLELGLLRKGRNRREQHVDAQSAHGVAAPVHGYEGLAGRRVADSSTFSTTAPRGSSP